LEASLGGDGRSQLDSASPDARGDAAPLDGNRGGEERFAPEVPGDARISDPDVSAADDSGGADLSAQDDSSGCPGTTCPPVAKACVLACGSPADCVYDGISPGSIYDVDNWVCKSGRCAHLGCLSDSECAATPGLDYAPMKCATVSGGYKSCLAACAGKADCPHPSRVDSPLYGADNYECKNGVCSYIGCHSDAECQAGIPGTALTWVCSSALHGFPICSTPCDTAADCTYLAGNPIFDVDNYACDQGICRHLGCQSDAECAQAYAATGLSYVCAESFAVQ
jgi:hypothetical protein